MDYDKTKYKIWTWKSPVVFHSIINPFYVPTDLLGVGLPRVMLIERNSSVENALIPCPHCRTLHSRLKWSIHNEMAYNNWFGLYCDNCEKIIPCFKNLISYILLGVTFPIWFWFKDKWKAKWLEKQKVKFSKPLDITQPKIKWWLVALIFGFLMFVTITVLPTYISKRGTIELLAGIYIWTIMVGVSFGLLMKWTHNEKTDKDNSLDTAERPTSGLAQRRRDVRI